METFRMTLSLTVLDDAGEQPLSVSVDHLVIAGWAARDTAKQQHHIDELAAIGVKPPTETPTFYRTAAARLTTAPRIECVGGASSGEAETVVFCHDGTLYVGVGSDHTDREAEAHGIALSKQMCDKPVAAQVWRMDDVADHWDQLILRSWRWKNGTRHLYQEGAVSSLLTPDDVIARYTGGKGLSDGMAVFGGTMPAIGGIRAGDRFDCELEDPVRGRSIRFGYDIVVLPVAG